jgi:hypothetical protein
MTEQEALWTSVLFIALSWALISAIVATAGVRYELSRLAWGWTASFVLSSLVAAYAFWRLP